MSATKLSPARARLVDLWSEYHAADQLATTDPEAEQERGILACLVRWQMQVCLAEISTSDPEDAAIFQSLLKLV